MKKQLSLNKYDVEAIIISPSWPSNNSGYGFAIKCSLELYCIVFSKIYFIGLTESPFTAMDQWEKNSIAWIHIPIIKRPKIIRFLKSLCTVYPAVIIQFVSRIIKEKILSFIYFQQKSGRKIVIIFEDMPPAYLVDSIRRKFPSIPISIRSHNVLSKAFEGFSKNGLIINRIAWKYENSKIREFEINLRKNVDRLWAISEKDKVEYWNKIGVCCDGVFGVSIDINRYNKVESGDLFSIICIGSTDLRKKYSLLKFIHTSWKEIHNKFPNARFILAGKGTENLTNKDFGVKGLGFINDDRYILSKGMIFVNTQEFGSGIKLKSIIAMLSGKALVSTPTGIEGIAGIEGEHFLVADTFEDFAPLIIRLLNDKKYVLKLGINGRKLASETYNREAFEKRVRPLLEEFLFLTLKL